MEYIQSNRIMYIIVFSLKFLTVKELSTKSHFILWVATLNQHLYYKGIVTSGYGALQKRFFCLHRELELVDSFQTNIV